MAAGLFKAVERFQNLLEKRIRIGERDAEPVRIRLLYACNPTMTAHQLFSIWTD